MGGAGDCGVGKGEEMHRSHCVWKGWGEEGLPPTNVCVRCGCFSTFRCVNLRKVCKGTFGSEAARKRVGLSRHPTGGQLLRGWRKVEWGNDPGRVKVPILGRGEQCRDLAGWVGLDCQMKEGQEEKEGEGEVDFGMGLWMDEGREEEEEEDLEGRGFLGFDQP